MNDMNENEVNRFADSVKNSGNLKKGDTLHLPAGISQTIRTYRGNETLTLDVDVDVVIDYVNYGRYRIRAVDDSHYKTLSDSGFTALYKESDYGTVIKVGNEIITDWSHFKQ